MKHLTDQILEQAIVAIPEVEFDTHRIIRELMINACRQYADDLGATPGLDPIMALHSAIGTRMLSISSVKPTKKVLSMNVRGQNTENQEWRKYSAGMVRSTSGSSIKSSVPRKSY
jgi:hypothetical protein